MTNQRTADRPPERIAAPLRKPRQFGWGATAAAFVVAYVFWIVARHVWIPSVALTGLLLALAAGFNIYLAVKTKAYDLYLSAALAVLSPAIVIFVAFGVGFSGA